MVDKTTNNKLGIISLYRSNYLSSFYTREMAKLLNKSHVTLLPHLKSLEDENIITSKTIGKNKTYTLNLDNISTKEQILLSEITETTNYLKKNFLIKKIFSEIFNLDLNGTIILFGSYAKNTFTKDSDIDILYFGKIKPSQERDIKKIGKIYGKTINIKKVKDFSLALRKKDTLILEVIKNHIILQDSEVIINILWRYFNEIKT
jgi:predicted nucleotidyltransferase